MSSFAVNLSTLSGESHQCSFLVGATALQCKLQVAADLGRPADLQRWLLNGVAIEDEDELATFQLPDSEETLEVLCVFLPRTFDLKVQVVKFTPGALAQSAEEVCISVSPTMTVDAAKFEALAAAGLSNFDEAARNVRLIKEGLHLKEDRTIEHYHIDPDSKLHLVVPRSPGDDLASLQTNSSDINLDLEGLKKAEAFHKLSGSKSNADEISKTCEADKEDSKTILSPRSTESASVFTRMGVHRLRPRSASTPVVKSRSKQEANSTSSHPGASDDRAGASSNTLVTPQATSGEVDTVVPQAASPCMPRKPRDLQVAPSRPARARTTSRCASPRARRSVTLATAVRPQTSAGSDRPHTAAGVDRPHTAAAGTARPQTSTGSDRAQGPTGFARPPRAPTGLRRPARMLRAEAAQSTEPSEWLLEWAAQPAPSEVFTEHDRSASYKAACMKRSTSCRASFAAGIDRFASGVACCC